MQGLIFPNRLLIKYQHKFLSVSIALRELQEVRGVMGEATLLLILDGAEA